MAVESAKKFLCCREASPAAVPLRGSAIHGKAIKRAPMRSAPFIARSGDEEICSDWLGWLFRAIDFLLRRCLGIREFCSDRHCIIRVALVAAAEKIVLADGTLVRDGDTIGELHLWNEQLPQLPWRGSSIAWAMKTRRSFEHSLSQLAFHASCDPAFTAIDAFRGGITFAGGPGRTAKVARVTERLGFEITLDSPGSAARFRAILDGLFVHFLIRAFNPASAKNGGLLRQRYYLWISKRNLMARYGPQETRIPADRHRGAALGTGS